VATEPAEKPPAEEPSPAEKPSLVDRLQSQRERHLQRSKPMRALWVLAGFTILAAGVAMLVTPGPAFVVIPIGLAILSLEFAWAETLLQHAIERAEMAKQKASETTATQRVLSGVATALGIGAVLAWALLGDIPIAPV
jgi:uncharacterized protein (TIGR02611 family)